MDDNNISDNDSFGGELFNGGGGRGGRGKGLLLDNDIGVNGVRF